MASTGSKIKVACKSISWAFVSGIIIGVTAYTQSGSFRIAIVTAIVSACLKTPFYSAHEVAFDAFWHRKDKPEAKKQDTKQSNYVIHTFHRAHQVERN